MARWIKFTQVGDTGKTKVYRVENKENGSNLGIIKWYGGFRQYAYLPAGDCVLEKTCLGDITEFLRELMEARKTGKPFQEPRE